MAYRLVFFFPSVPRCSKHNLNTGSFKQCFLWCSNSGPFGNPALFNQPNTGLIRYSDPQCILLYQNQRNIFLQANKENSPPKPLPEDPSASKTKKTKYVALYSSEGQAKEVVMLKGRHVCECQASKHGLVNNCLQCGKIVCTQEGEQ